MTKRSALRCWNVSALLALAATQGVGCGSDRTRSSSPGPDGAAGSAGNATGGSSSAGGSAGEATANAGSSSGGSGTGLDASAPPNPDDTEVLACEGNCSCDETDAGAASSCTCTGDTECVATCTEGCNLDCSGTSRCEMSCNENCNATCPGTSGCEVTVGGDSTGSCSGTGDCDFVCQGDCAISCEGASRCRVACPEGDATCEITGCLGQLTDCGGGVQVCRTECPGAADAGQQDGGTVPFPPTPPGAP